MRPLFFLLKEKKKKNPSLSTVAKITNAQHTILGKLEKAKKGKNKHHNPTSDILTSIYASV
jgi:hypothetical protein